MTGYEVLANYLKWLESHQRANPVYRGHADSQWLLQPSAFRPMASGISNMEELTAWQDAASRFVSPQPSSDVEWLVLAQHFGIATPLLDWTTNPLIGLFFACQATKDEAMGQVWQCDRGAFEALQYPQTVQPFDEARIIPGLIRSTAMNARTLAQDSIMSIHSHSHSRMGIASHQGETFDIAPNLKIETLMALRRFGFSGERLYADLVTVAQSFRNQLLVGKLMKIGPADYLPTKRATL